MSDVCWGQVETQFGTFGVWVDARGRLTKLWLDLKRALKSELALPRDDRAVRHVVREIQEYAGGKRKAFTLDLAPEGTPFQLSVWNALLKIPYGETTSYGALANQLGFAKGARAVGHANGSNPIALIIPCHRVIGANGSLTGFGGGLPMKKALLAFEAEHAEKPGDFFGRVAKRR